MKVAGPSTSHRFAFRGGAIGRLALVVMTFLVGCGEDGSAPSSPETSPARPPKWRAEVIGDFRDVWGSSPTNVFAVGTDADNILRFDGVGWTPSYLAKTGAEFLAVTGSSENKVFAAGRLMPSSFGAIYQYDGVSWAQVLYPTATGQPLTAISAGSDNIAFAVGPSGTIYRYDGITWSQVAPPTGSPTLFAVWCPPGGEAFAVGASGLAYRYEPSTAQWTRFDILAANGGRRHLFGVWGNSTSNVYAVGDSGSIYHFNGSEWNQMVSGTAKTFHDIWGTSSSDIYAVGEGGTILHFDGSNWSAMESNTVSRLMGVWSTPGGETIAVGQPGIFRRSPEPVLGARPLQ